MKSCICGNIAYEDNPNLCEIFSGLCEDCILEKKKRELIGCENADCFNDCYPLGAGDFRTTPLTCRKCFRVILPGEYKYNSTLDYCVCLDCYKQFYDLPKNNTNHVQKCEECEKKIYLGDFSFPSKIGYLCFDCAIHPEWQDQIRINSQILRRLKNQEAPRG